MGIRSIPPRQDHLATPHVRAVMELFSLTNSENSIPRALRRHVPLKPGQIILITGPSGSGKSTLLRALTRGLETKGLTQVRLEDLRTDQSAALVDCFPGLPVKQSLAFLARAGLAEGKLFLRRPAELSEGERFRFRLAQFYAGHAPFLIADEFGATLDRITARIVAYNLRQFIGRSPQRSAILATCHEDLVEDLRPEVWVRKKL